MKRAIYEWCGLSFAGLAISCCVAWGVSLVNSRVTLDLSFGNRMQMIAAEGSVTFCDRVDSTKHIENAKKSRSYFNGFLPPATAVHVWSIPGFQVGVLSFEDGDAMWSLRFSLLLASVIFLAIGGFCLYRYRNVRRQMLVGAPSVT